MPRDFTDQGILRKTFRGVQRAWYDKLPSESTDGPGISDDLRFVGMLSNRWATLDTGPVIQQGAYAGSSLTDERGQIFNALEAPVGFLLRLTALAVAESDGGTSILPRLGWWISNQQPAGTPGTTAAYQEGQAQKDVPDAVAYFGDLNASLQTYHFGSPGLARLPIDRLFAERADGRFFFMRIDTGAAQGTNLRWVVEWEALRTDDFREIDAVGRAAYRGD